MSPEASEAATPEVPIGYWRLLRHNRPYRRLWYGQVVSMAGDWFRLIALYYLVLRLSGASGLALGGVLIAQTLAIFMLSPVAGVVADRFNRKTIMIVTDLVRAILTLGFLLLTSAERLWLAYTLTAAIMAVSAFFYPAFVATIPNLTKRDELVAANALSSATWAAMMALGSGLGGLVTTLLGTSAAFLFDAFSYLVSAVCIASVAFPARNLDAQQRHEERRQSGWRNFVRGVQYIRRRTYLVRLLTVKTWSVGVGGGLVLLITLLAESVFRAGATGMGVFYMVRGLGAVLGPILARRLLGEEPLVMYQALGFAFLIMASLYVVFAAMPTLWLAAGVLCIATMAANVLWVFSSTLLQLGASDAYRGRVFAADFALFTIAMAVSTFLTGWALDHLNLGVRLLTALLGGVLLLPGIFRVATRRRPLPLGGESGPGQDHE